MADRRAPIGRLVDLAVAVPTCTMVAAARAVPIAARVGTFGTARLVGRISDAVYEARHKEEHDETLDRSVSPPVADGDADEPGLDIDADELPIEGYDDLAARQVVARIGSLQPGELAMIEAYEQRHRNRSTVLGKIAQLQA